MLLLVIFMVKCNCTQAIYIWSVSLQLLAFSICTKKMCIPYSRKWSTLTNCGDKKNTQKKHNMLHFDFTIFYWDFIVPIFGQSILVKISQIVTQFKSKYFWIKACKKGSKGFPKTNFLTAGHKRVVRKFLRSYLFSINAFTCSKRKQSYCLSPIEVGLLKCVYTP